MPPAMAVEASEIASDRGPRLRFAFGTAFWRVAAAVFVTRELLLWRLIGRVAPGLPWRRRVAWWLLNSPKSLFYAFLVGALVAVLADLLVRFLVRPRAHRWLRPQGEVLGTPHQFHLAADERVEAEMPARRASGSGRRWSPGGLILTNRRLWFFPFAWDAEPWSLPLDRGPRVIRTEPAPRLFWGLIGGLPDRLALSLGAEPQTVFAVADPGEVLAWLGLDLPEESLDRGRA